MPQNFHGSIHGISTAYPHQHESIFRAIPASENARVRRKELPDAAHEMQKSAFPIGKCVICGLLGSVWSVW